jgi:sigma-E factor negative regulatory protein RseA
MTETALQQTLRESLSALVDNQASDMELRRVLRESEVNGELRRLWGRYQLIGSALRHELPAGVPVDLTAGIWAAIDAEEQQVVSQPAAARATRWWSGFGRAAIAASVAGVVIVSAQIVQRSNPGEVAAVAQAPAAAPAAPAALPAGFAAPDIAARTVSTHARLESGRESRAVPQLMVPTQQAAVPSRPSAEVQAYLQQVLQLHAVNAAAGSPQGMLPYARIPVDAE